MDKVLICLTLSLIVHHSLMVQSVQSEDCCASIQISTSNSKSLDKQEAVFSWYNLTEDKKDGYQYYQQYNGLNIIRFKKETKIPSWGVYQGPIFHTDTQSPKVTFVGCAEKCPGNCINDVQIWTYYDSFDNEHIHDSKILLKCAKVNCIWNAWQNTTECCSTGRMQRTRTKKVTEKYDGDCPDPRTSEEIECDVEECPDAATRNGVLIGTIMGVGGFLVVGALAGVYIFRKKNKTKGGSKSSDSSQSSESSDDDHSGYEGIEVTPILKNQSLAANGNESSRTPDVIQTTECENINVQEHPTGTENPYYQQYDEATMDQENQVGANEATENVERIKVTDNPYYSMDVTPLETNVHNNPGGNKSSYSSQSSEEDDDRTTERVQMTPIPNNQSLTANGNESPHTPDVI